LKRGLVDRSAEEARNIATAAGVLSQRAAWSLSCNLSSSEQGAAGSSATRVPKYYFIKETPF